MRNPAPGLVYYEQKRRIMLTRYKKTAGPLRVLRYMVDHLTHRESTALPALNKIDERIRAEREKYING